MIFFCGGITFVIMMINGNYTHVNGTKVQSLVLKVSLNRLKYNRRIKIRFWLSIDPFSILFFVDCSAEEMREKTLHEFSGTILATQYGDFGSNYHVIML